MPDQVLTHRSQNASVPAYKVSETMPFPSHRTRRPANKLNQGNTGEAARMAKIKEGNVVRDFKIGNTRVKICDDYCRDKTPEEVNAILTRIAQRAQERLSALAAERAREVG